MLPELSDAALDAGAQHLPLRMGCTCPEASYGPRPPHCRCDERSARLARENVRQIVEAVLEATDG